MSLRHQQPPLHPRLAAGFSDYSKQCPPHDQQNAKLEYSIYSSSHQWLNHNMHGTCEDARPGEKTIAPYAWTNDDKEENGFPAQIHNPFDEMSKGMSAQMKGNAHADKPFVEMSEKNLDKPAIFPSNTRLPLFYGDAWDGFKVESWVWNAEGVLDILGIPKDQWVMLAALSLVREARRWFREYLERRCGVVAWKEFTCDIVDQFIDTQSHPKLKIKMPNKEAVTTPTRESICNPSKLLEDESLPKIKTLGNVSKVWKDELGKQSKNCASEQSDSSVLALCSSVATECISGSTSNSFKHNSLEGGTSMLVHAKLDDDDVAQQYKSGKQATPLHSRTKTNSVSKPETPIIPPSIVSSKLASSLIIIPVIY